MCWPHHAYQVIMNLRLHNVLYIPQFHFNLIFILKLVNIIKCVDSFSNNSYIIKDLTSQRMIGNVDHINSLYILNYHPITHSALGSIINDYHYRYANIVCNENFDVWHLPFIFLKICVNYFLIFNSIKRLICDSLCFQRLRER